jgi:hypothetical protein
VQKVSLEARSEDLVPEGPEGGSHGGLDLFILIEIYECIVVGEYTSTVIQGTLDRLPEHQSMLSPSRECQLTTKGL